MTVVAFTGHRPDKLGGYDPNHPVVAAVRHAIAEALAEVMPDLVLSGMALGVDQWAADACIDADIPFTAVLPCSGMDAPWPPPARAHFQLLLEWAADIVVVSPGPYKPWKMQKRNEWLVDNCDVLLAIHDGSAGGTLNCIEYAEKVGREVKRLEWRDREPGGA